MITNVTMFWDLDYDTYAGVATARSFLENQIREMLKNKFSQSTEEAILRILFFRGSVGVKMQVLTSNFNVISSLKFVLALLYICAKFNLPLVDMQLRTTSSF